jgi:hypothetical protein
MSFEREKKLKEVVDVEETYATVGAVFVTQSTVTR